jgi:hypothetical protein
MKGRGAEQPAVGVLLVSAEEATIAEWHPRRVEILRKQEFDFTEAEKHELVGPSISRPRHSGDTNAAPHASGRRDLWERRLDDHRARFARSAADSAARTAQNRGWDVVLVLGDPRRAVPAAEELAKRGVMAVRSKLVLDWLRPAALASRLAPEVERARAEVTRAGSARR